MCVCVCVCVGVCAFFYCVSVCARDCVFARVCGFVSLRADCQCERLKLACLRFADAIVRVAFV